MRMWVLLPVLCATSALLAQDYPRRDFQPEKLADEIFPLQDLDLNYEELYENLAQLLANPIDLNQVTREQLRSFMVLTEVQINEFLSYREQNGPLLSVYELQSVPSWSRETFVKVIPFVTVRDLVTRMDASIFSRMVTEQNNYLLMRYERVVETRKGFRESTDSLHRYAGSPDKLYVRYRVANPKDFSLGLTLEKDPGEAVKWDPAHKQYGTDYVSFHAQVQNKGKLKNLIVGDFQSQFGQGLILGSVFGFGKNSETVTTVRRSNLGFLPYTAAGENLFFRGAAASYELSKGILLHGFVSDVFKDGNIHSTTDESMVISALSGSGLHRTAAEVHDRKQVQEIDLGAILQIKNRQLDAGLLFHQIQLSRPLLSNPTPYNQFAYSGNTNQNAGIYMNYSWANVTFFSELSQSIGSGRALITGILGTITSSLEFSLLYRNFDRNFYSFNANAFSENTYPQNEKGFYYGCKYAFNKRFSASGYLDLFQFPWVRYRGYAPSNGSEWLLRLNYTPSKTVLIFIQAREESKGRNLSDNTSLYQLTEGIKRNYWINCDYVANSNLSFKTRLQFRNYVLNGITTRGLTLAQDVSFSLHRWSFSFRHALFDSDDYDNRLYLYERDVWLAYSFPAYYGVGVRNYVLIQYKFSKWLDVWFRWSKVRYYNRAEIGSGGETIAGNTENDVKFQARIKF